MAKPTKSSSGGIAASLMHDRFSSERRWQGIRFIKGLLSAPPAIALQLDEFSEELYADDVDGRPIEDLIPDYGILSQIGVSLPGARRLLRLYLARLHPEMPLLRRAQAGRHAAGYGVSDLRRQ